MALPTSATSKGPTPRSYTDIRQDIVNRATVASPGYTADLPGSLIEDMVGTIAGATSLMEQARIDVLNSISASTANRFILNLLGAQVGIFPRPARPAQVYIVASGPAGWIINKGFIITDNSRQYVAVETGVIRSSGVSDPILFECTSAGVFAIPANSVRTPVTSIPSGITITFDNPNVGTPGQEGAESIESYRARVLASYQSPAVGFGATIRARLYKVKGVEQRLVSVRQNGASGGIRVIVGGGDSLDIATALYESWNDPSALLGSADEPNRNVVVAVEDYPDTYNYKFIRPKAQSLKLAVTWNTTNPNLVAEQAVADVIRTQAVGYINSIPVGTPFNQGEFDRRVRENLVGVIDSQNLSRLEVSYILDGNNVVIPAGTTILSGNPEGYFVSTLPDITVIRG